MDFSTDEYFGTLGGSLMKDLLADLQVEDGDFSLEQLEKELAQLDHEPTQSRLQPQQALPAFDAASTVVSHAQGLNAGSGLATLAPKTTNQDMDAWSLSLQNFTAMSLQDDFLAADSARKQQQQKPMAFDGAEDYDIQEKPAVGPPPGLPPGLGGMMGTPTSASAPPEPKPFPKTPQNSLTVANNLSPAQSREQIAGLVPAVEALQTKQPPVTPTPPKLPATQEAPAPQTTQRQSPPPAPQAVVPQGVPPPHPSMVNPNVPFQHMPPPGAMPPPHPGAMPHTMGPPMVGGQMGPPMMAGNMPGGPAWQTPPMVPMPPPVRAFCNPHPSAPPIPATVLESKLMDARDIAYVVHSILKPILAAGESDSDYHVQYLRRLGDPQANAKDLKEKKDINDEMASRATKTKEWSSEKAVLGVVTKTNVTRPRALIATPVAPSENDTEQKQRASLWKARVYCDQAYQSYQAVVEIWRSAPPGGVPPQVQMHLAKLMKCIGITHVDKEYQVDSEALNLLLKLTKGRALIARVIEQGLLPPNAVQSMLSPLLDSLLVVAKKADSKSDELTNERLFRSITGVIQKLNFSGTTMLNCLQSVQRNGKNALSSSAKMECVHTILQKGQHVVSQDQSQEVKTAWSKAEGEFMVLLQGI